VDAGEKLLAEVISKLLRDKKILAQAEERACCKALCLASEMSAEGENVNAESIDCLAASVGMEFSPAMWATLGMIDDAVATHGTAQVTGDSL
jgi:predicted butyrate kinase (DUF1464 family)